MNTKDEDVIKEFITASTHADLLFFSSLGKVYRTKMYDLPEGRRATKGKFIANFLPLTDGETVTSVLAIKKGRLEGKDDDGAALMMVTRDGTIKKTDLSQFSKVRANGLIALGLKGDNRLVDARVVEEGDTVILATYNGQAIRFQQKDIRPMGRTAAGVRGIKVGADDRVISMSVIRKGMEDVELLTLSENGSGKKTKVSEYKIQGRGGSGIKAMKITDKTGKLVGATIVTDDHEELIAMSSKSQVIRTALDQIPTLGRDTQGVSVMKLKAGDTVASFVRF